MQLIGAESSVLKQPIALRANSVAIVAHDAGGAELLAHFIKRGHLLWACFVLDGPAVSVFCRVLGDVRIVTLESALNCSDWILTGSSWQSDLEWRALQLARTLGKPSVTFLDHWVNYRDRFIRMSKRCLPDVLWVADSYAQKIAELEFPDTIIKNIGNPYLESITKQAASKLNILESCWAHRVLIVTEPVSEHAIKQYGDAMHFGYTEFGAIELMLERLPHLLGDKPLKLIVVRPHPYELPHKYEYLVDNPQRLPVVIRKDGDLLDEVLESTIVIGCQTMALVVAIAAGRRAVSCIPEAGRPCSLPYEQIERLR